MFKKVLVAEDFDSISIAVGQVLKELSVPEIHHAKYCDDAFLKIKKAPPLFQEVGLSVF